MKRKLSLLWGLWLGLALPLFGQPLDSVVTYDSLAIPYEQQLDTLFSALDYSQVSSGLLMDRSLKTLPVEWYEPGVPLSDSNCAYPWEFNAAYGTLQRAAIDQAHALPDQAISLDPIRSQVSDSDTIPIGLIFYEYQQFRPDALSSNLIYLDQGQVKDVAGRPQHPYETHQLLLAAPAIWISERLSPRFRLDSRLFFSNIGASINSIEIDFGDGPQHCSIANL